MRKILQVQEGERSDIEKIYISFLIIKSKIEALKTVNPKTVILSMCVCKNHFLFFLFLVSSIYLARTNMKKLLEHTQSTYDREIPAMCGDHLYIYIYK